MKNDTNFKIYHSFWDGWSIIYNNCSVQTNFPRDWWSPKVMFQTQTVKTHFGIFCQNWLQQGRANSTRALTRIFKCWGNHSTITNKYTNIYTYTDVCSMCGAHFFCECVCKCLCVAIKLLFAEVINAIRILRDLTIGGSRNFW